VETASSITLRLASVSMASLAFHAGHATHWRVLSETRTTAVKHGGPANLFAVDYKGGVGASIMNVAVGVE